MARIGFFRENGDFLRLENPPKASGLSARHLHFVDSHSHLETRHFALVIATSKGANPNGFSRGPRRVSGGLPQSARKTRSSPTLDFQLAALPHRELSETRDLDRCINRT